MCMRDGTCAHGKEATAIYIARQGLRLRNTNSLRLPKVYGPGTRRVLALTQVVPALRCHSLLLASIDGSCHKNLNSVGTTAVVI